MYIEQLSFDEVRLKTNAMLVISPLTLLNLLCSKKKRGRKNVHLMHMRILDKCVPSEKFWAVI